MADHNDISKNSDPRISHEKPRRNRGILALKIIAWVLGALIVIAGAVIWGISAYINPERITKIIEQKSAEYLKADLKIGKLDYKFWRTYPWLEFEIDSLTLISRSLEGLNPSEREKLPENADFLASVEKLKGKINVHSLLHDDIEMKGIEITRPKANIVMVNDSVSNFDILKSKPSTKKIPEIDISDINVTAPVDLSFFSLQNNLQAHAGIEDFFVTKNDNFVYDIGFEGNVGGRYQDYAVNSVPLKFKTTVKPSFDDLTLRLNNLSMVLAGVRTEINGEIIADKKGIDLREADLNVSIEDIFTLIYNLPDFLKDKINIPDGISGYLPVVLSLHLKDPFFIDPGKKFSFSPEELPSVLAVVKVAEANLLMQPPKGKKIEADDIYFEAVCDFDAKNPDATNLQIHNLRMNGEGINLTGNAELSNLTAQQQDFKGNFNFSSPVMETLAYFIPALPVKVAGYLKGNIEFSGEAMNFGKNGLKDLAFAGELNSHSLKINGGSNGSYRLRNMKTGFKGTIPSYPLSDYAGTGMDLVITADSIYTTAQGAKVELAKFELKLDGGDTISGSPDPFGSLLIKAGAMNMTSNGNRFKGKDISMKANGMLNSSGPGNYTVVNVSNGGNDEIIESRIDHTPLVLDYQGGGIMSTLMGMIKLKGSFKMSNGELNTPDYLYPILINNLEITSNLNNYKVEVDNVTISNTSFRLNGEFEGLEPFLTSYSATPLKGTADIRFKNVDINRLSYGYYGALQKAGADSVYYVPPMAPPSKKDSLCIVIPRNIDAKVRLFSESAEYMQYKFSPLSTQIVVKDGVASLLNLTVGAPYCTAVVDWIYSTVQLDNIFMNLRAKVKDFKFKNFYEVFPTLVTKTPELANFTGVIDADIACDFEMFPDMYMDAASLKGRCNLNGTELEFAREGKIERITHLLLIKGDEPIKIQNVNILATYHDNLLQVNPFKICFDDYQLELAGINNTAGNMYYHLALEKSPFHLPFGVSLLGTFKHPEIKVGGTHIEDYHSQTVSSEPDTKINVNIMKWLSHGWQIFIKEAARYEAELSE